MRIIIRKYCFEDITTIDVTIDAIGKINNEKALEIFLQNTYLNNSAYIKILQLTIEAEPIFITIIYEDGVYKVQIDGLNTSSPFKLRYEGNKIVVSKKAGRTMYNLYNDDNLINTMCVYIYKNSLNSCF